MQNNRTSLFLIVIGIILFLHTYPTFSVPKTVQTLECIESVTNTVVDHDLQFIPDYIVLNKDISFVKQVKEKNKTYVIKYDFDLKGQTVKIPQDCVLKFVGGRLYNGQIIFDKTIIESPLREFFDHISVSGTIANREVRLSWWCLGYSIHVNDAVLINQIISAIDNCVLYFDIIHDIYVGTDKTDGSSDETIDFVGKNNLIVVQDTDKYTVLRGRSKTGGIIRCYENHEIVLDGLRIDGSKFYYSKWGENGIGVVGNKRASIQNCIIKNCFSNCFDRSANGTLLKNGYPEWGYGGKGIQIEGGNVCTQVMIKNNHIADCYIGVSNNASDKENVMMIGNQIDSCYMSIVLLRLNRGIQMKVRVDSTIICNNTGNIGAICMGDATDVYMSNTLVKGNNRIKSILRGCFSNSIIQLDVKQACDCLIDAALYRDNPEGEKAINNYIRIVSDQSCDNIINTTKIIPKRGGGLYAEFVGGIFDITINGGLKRTPILLPAMNQSSYFYLRNGEKASCGIMEQINKNTQ